MSLTIDPLLDIKDVMRLTKLSESSVRRRMKDGRLASVKDGKRRLIRTSALVAMITKLTDNNTP